jgi:hypothetical protein
MFEQLIRITSQEKLYSFKIIAQVTGGVRWGNPQVGG